MLQRRLLTEETGDYEETVLRKRTESCISESRWEGEEESVVKSTKVRERGKQSVRSTQ